MPWEQQHKAPDGGAPPWGSLPEHTGSQPPPAVDVAVSGGTPSSVAVTVSRGAAAAQTAEAVAPDAEARPRVGGVHQLGERRVRASAPAHSLAAAPRSSAAARTAPAAVKARGGAESALTPMISFLDKEAGELDPFSK